MQGNPPAAPDSRHAIDHHYHQNTLNHDATNRNDTSRDAINHNTTNRPTVAGMDMERIEAPVSFKAYLMCCFAAFAGVLFGYDSGYISSVLGMDEFKRWYGHPVPLSVDPSGYLYATWQKSLVVSILSAGTFFGALFSGALADWMGRRATIIAGCIIFIVGVALQVTAPDIPALCIGRLVAGVGVGFVSAITILYMSEVAPRRARAPIVSSYQFAITLGIMLASCVTFATHSRRDAAAFRIPIAIQFLWATILGIGLFVLPESPRYYVKKKRLDLAIKALGRVRGQPQESEWLQDELAEIQANYEYEQQVGEVTWLGCFTGGLHSRNSNLRKVFIGTSVQMMQQFTGINFIIYYNTTFFQQVNLQNPFLLSTITTIVNMCSTPVSFYTIERFGRRSILIWGAVAMTICEFVIAIVGTAEPDSTTANYILIVFVCLYIFSFATSWGPGAWVLTGEIFQLPIRAKGVAMSTASNWLWNCTISIVVPYMVDPGAGDLGSRVFFVWGTTCALCAVFAYIFIPETKGLTLEQVDKMMEEVSARRSAKWQAHDHFVQSMSLNEVSGGRNYQPPSRPGTDDSINSELVSPPKVFDR